MGVYKKGKNWFIDYRNPPGRSGKRIREKVGPVTKDEATIVLSTRLKDILVGRNPELRRIAPKPFADMATEFLARHVGVPVELYNAAEGAVRVRRKKGGPAASLRKDADGFIINVNALLRRFAGRTLQEINPKAIEDFVAARLAEGASKATCNRHRSCLSKIFNCAIDWGYYGGDNPVRRVKPFRESPGRVRFLSRDESAKLLEKASDYLRPILIAALHSGGRLSEILSLRFEDVDLERGVLYFDQTNTKSGKQREIPIDADLAAVLQERRRHRFAGGDAREYVFTWHRKRVCRITTAFEKARKRADLGKDVTFHTLRHTFASWYMINGGDIFRLQKYLGHSEIALTQRYAHLSKDYLKAGVEFFGPPAAIGGHSVDTKGGQSQGVSGASA